MKCKITASIVRPKYAKINFLHSKDKEYKGFVREATAFPFFFDNDERVSITFDDFSKALSPGNTVDVIWSKKLNSFVVRFSDKDFDDLPF